MNTLNELSQAEKKQRILVLCNENEIAGLQAQGLPVSCEDSLLSMQHLKMARLEAERRHKLKAYRFLRLRRSLCRRRKQNGR